MTKLVAHPFNNEESSLIYRSAVCSTEIDPVEDSKAIKEIFLWLFPLCRHAYTTLDTFRDGFRFGRRLPHFSNKRGGLAVNVYST